MDQIEEFVDQRQKSWCIHCGKSIAEVETNRDHVPSKGFLLQPYPPNLPRVQVCKACNVGFSPDEEYLFAFLGSVLTGSTEPERQCHPTAARVLKRNMKLRTRIERSKEAYETRGGETQVIWKPDAATVSRVIVKNARGHAFFEYGEPMLHAPQSVWCMPLQSLTVDEREDFENLMHSGLSGWPEVGSRMMTRIATGQDLSNGWVIVQDNIYRYAAVQAGVMYVRSVIFEYLATEVYWDD